MTGRAGKLHGSCAVLHTGNTALAGQPPYLQCGVTQRSLRRELGVGEAVERQQLPAVGQTDLATGTVFERSSSADPSAESAFRMPPDAQRR